MSLVGVEEAPCWYVLHTHPNQESRAYGNLLAWNIEAFAPRIKERRINPFNGVSTFVTRPLFPRYIFARFKVDDLLHKVRFTRGICGVVSFGGQPTPVSGEVISMIKSRMGEDGAVIFYEDIEPGSVVMVKEGPFKGFSAIFQRRLKGTTRLLLLLQTVSYQARVVVDSEQVSKLH